MDRIDKLVADLSDKAAPIKPMPHPLRLVIIWSAMAALYLLLLLAHSGLRADIAVKLKEPLYLSEILLLGIMILASEFSVALLSFPDSYQKRWVTMMPFLPLMILCVVLGIEFIADSPPSPKPPHDPLECVVAIACYALLPAGWIFYHLRRMASTRPLLASFVAILVAWSIGCFALRLSEKTDSMAHLLEWHYLPMLAVSAAGIWFGRRFLRW